MGSSSADITCESGFWFLSFREARGPTGTAVEMGTDLNRLVSGQGQRQPQEEPRASCQVSGRRQHLSWSL